MHISVARPTKRTTWKFPSPFRSCVVKVGGSCQKKTTGYCTPHSKSILCPCQTYLDKGITFRWMRMYHGAYGWVVPWKMYLLWSRASCLTKSWFNHHSVFTLSPFRSSTEHYFNRVNCTQDIVVQHLEPDRISELEALATMFSKDFPSFDRGVRYYRSLVDMAKPRKPFDRLAFVDAGPMIGQGLAQVQLPARPPAPMNHWLQVVFHHSRG